MSCKMISTKCLKHPFSEENILCSQMQHELSLMFFYEVEREKKRNNKQYKN